MATNGHTYDVLTNIDTYGNTDVDYDERIENISVDDFTNWPLYWKLYYNKKPSSYTGWKEWTFDKLTSGILATLGSCSFYYEHMVNIIKSSSYVNSGTTNLFKAYRAPTQLSFLRHKASRNFDIEAALFFIHISALVYEDPTTIVIPVVDYWNNQNPLLTIKGAVAKESAMVYVWKAKITEKYTAIVLSFKGTSPFDYIEWASDATLSQQQTNGFISNVYDHELIHEGFLKALTQRGDQPYGNWEKIKELLKKTIYDIKKETNQKFIPIWITGHSLGAAVATVAMARLLNKVHDDFGKDVIICGAYTFGTPRVGNKVFAENYNSKLQELNAVHYRVINCNDIITRIPKPNWGKGYQFVGTPVTISHEPNIRFEEPDTKLRWKNWFESFTESIISMKDSWVEFLKVIPKKEETDPDSIKEKLKSGITNYSVKEDAEVRTNAVGLLEKTTGSVTYLILDHLPSEYIAHLKKLNK